MNYKKKIKINLPLLLIFFIPSLVYSGSPVLLDDKVGEYSLGKHLEILEDVDGRWTIDDVRSSDFENKWVKNERKVPNFAFTKSVYWLRFQVIAQDHSSSISSNENVNAPHIDQSTQYPSTWLVELSYAFIDQVDFFFETTNNKYHVIESGDLRAYSKREFKYRNFIFPITLNDNSSQVFYMRMKTEGSMQLPLTLWSTNAFVQKVDKEQIALGVYYGIVLAMLLYNIFVFLIVKEKTYLFYVLYIITWIIGQMIINGFAVQYLWGDLIWWVNPSFSLVCSILGFWIIIFSMSFLQLKKNVPTLYKFLNIFVWAFIFLAVFSLIIPFSISIRLVYYLFLSSLPLLILAGIFCWHRGFTAARYYLWAWVSLIIGVVIYLLKSVDILPSVFITEYGLQIGSAIEVIFLSLSLTDRINQEKKGKILAQKIAIDNLKLYEDLYKSSPQGLFQYNLNEKSLKCNDAFINLFGFKNRAEFGSENDVDSIINQLWEDHILVEKLDKDGQVINYEKKINSQANKPVFYVLINMRLIVDYNKNPIEVGGSFTDISEKKFKEHAEKEKREAEKKQLLTQQKMELALKDKEISEAKSRSKTEFFASMSHEFRTPLTSILGYSEAGQDNDLSIKEKNSYFKIINRSGDHFLHLINDVLDLSKLEIQELKFKNIKIHLLPILKEINDTFELPAREKGLDFMFNYQFPLPSIFTGDPTRLKQVLINLCGNAIKFTKSGSVSVDVYCDKADEKLYFSVTDTGIGLKPDQVDRLFESFSQADVSTTRNFGGTGLGLHLSQKLTQKLGGNITVKSDFGKGSTFTASIAIGSINNTEWIDGQPEHQSMEVAIRFSGKVLYAEDHEDNRNLVSSIIEKTGAEIVLASDGREALNFCENNQFDLIFTDIRMPQIDGVELAETLLEKDPSLIIVAITATLIESEQEKFKQAGFKKVLKKPINRHDIYAVMEEYLHRQIFVEKPTELESRKLIRVLLAEDDAKNQAVIELYLNKTDCDTTIVNDGLKAVSYALLKPYDLILMDMRMPNLSGMAAVRQLRSKGYCKPIYSLTADDTQVAIQECLDAGCDGHLSKPIIMDDLKAVIKSIRK